MERRIDAGALYTLHDYIRQVINASFDLFAIFFVLGGALDDAVIRMMGMKAPVSGYSQVRCTMIIKNFRRGKDRPSTMYSGGPKDSTKLREIYR